MITQYIEQAILEAVQDIYHRKYVGKIKVEELSKGFKVSLWFNKPEAPISISGEYSAEDFIKYIKKELKERHFEIVQYFTGYKYDRNDNIYCNG